MKRLLKRAALALSLAFVIVCAVALVQAWPALGATPSGERKARIEKSPQWKGDRFDNPEPIINDAALMLKGLLHVSADVSPRSPMPTAKVDPALYATAPETGVRATWLGHSTTLLEVDGKRFLTDPVWSDRPSPLTWVGPTRWYAPLIALEDLLPLDGVLISHDHYDHLDLKTVVALDKLTPRFFVPLGVGAHLESWGIAKEKIVELDWWESQKLGDFEVVACPARHQSGRFIRQNQTLWASWVLKGPSHRVYFSGDSGLFTALEDIGEKHGPFDLALFEVGQYHAAWPDWHMGPEQAVTATKRVKAQVLLPMHWGLLTLAYHGWTEPMERVAAEAKLQNVSFAAPKPGEAIEPARLRPFERWWPELPWETAQQHPVKSGNVKW